MPIQPPPISRANTQARSVPGTARPKKKFCKGQKLDIGSRSPWTSYPFGLHPHADLPWSVFVSDESLLLRSIQCEAEIRGDVSACSECSRILKHKIVDGILTRLQEGPHENLHWEYYTMANLVDLLERKNAIINKLKLNQLNLERSLLTRARHLDGFKRFVFAVSKGDIPRLHSLVTTMLEDGANIFGILQKISLAQCQLYNPKNYSDAEYKQQFLFHKLGGRAVAELAYQTQGMPSIDATRRYIRTQPLHPSPKMPTHSEMSANLDITYTSKMSQETSASKEGFARRHKNVGFQLMADEIKIESRLRWDSRSNMILGVCREHSDNYSLEFVTIEQPDAIIEGIAEKNLHFSTEVGSLIVLSSDVLMYIHIIRPQFSPSAPFLMNLKHIRRTPSSSPGVVNMKMSYLKPSYSTLLEKSSSSGRKTLVDIS
jgi:hypothetical protein